MSAPTKEQKNPKDYTDSPLYKDAHASLQREIQAPVMIDRACFIKTQEEKDQLKEAKSAWKKLHQNQ